MPPKQKAHSAAQAASKKKSSAVEIPHAVEQRIRAALQSLDVPWAEAAPATQAAAGASQRDTAAPAGGLPSEQQLLELYASLAQQGFEGQHVEAALAALPLPALSLETALDWLLLHLEAAQLPKRYVAQARAAGGSVDVKHVAQAPSAADAAAEQWSQQDAAAAAAAAAAAQAELEAQRAAAAERAAAEAAAAEAARAKEEEQRRAWIMQYMQESSEDESEDGGSSRVDSESDASSIEDWELHAGDLRQVEAAKAAKKAERARQQLSREDRVRLIASEMARAKADAAAAKASGNQAQQKACGQLIGQLRQEMRALGISDADLEAAAGPAEPTVQVAPLPAAASAAADQEEEAEEAQREEAGAAAGSSGQELAADGAPQREASADSDSEEEAGGLGFDLFGDSSAVEGAEVVKSKLSRAEKLAAAAAKAAAAAAAAAAQAGGGGGRKKGKQPAAPKVETQQPKALLQQHCQRCGWAAPRFERLLHGGMRLEGGGYRYSVAVEQGAGKGPKRRQQQQQQGPRTFGLREADDGWERIEDAQNAAATRALFELAASDATLQDSYSPLLLQLPPLFQELWLQWEEEGEDEAAAAAAAAETEEALAARQAFVQRLLSSAAAQQAAAQQPDSWEEAAAEDGQAGGWQQELLGAIAAAKGSAEAQHQQTAAQQRDSERLLQEQQAWRASEEGQRWVAERAKLPVVEIREQLVAALQAHDVCVVSGETGSGKTTQVPQYILEAAIDNSSGGACSIVCTQPRRIAAMSVAERVAAERGEAGPGQPGCKVGYHVRLDAATTRDTRLLFCTAGILLRRLAGDPALLAVSHVLVDEVHERTLQGDFLMALLRDLVAVRRAAGRPLKVVLMSATLDSSLFADYFASCPVLHAQGRTFPVEQLFLEDCYEATGYVLDADSPAALCPQWDRRAQRRIAATAGSKNLRAVQAGWGDAAADAGPLNPHFKEEALAGYSPSVVRNLAILDEDRLDFELLEALVAHIDESNEGQEGSILVFLPGMGEIQELQERLLGSRRFRANAQWVVPLHSTVSPSEQRQAFRVPPRGVRKVVLATNIAETSLTIEDVVWVVDAGKLKERRYDASRGMSLLVEDWVSAASAKQRRGRAGRVRPGVCYGLYTRDRFDHRMRRYQAPEMVRVPLEELVLQIHLLRLGRAGAFLARVLQPPPEKSVAGAIRTLQEVGALSPAEELTPLGHHLAALPVDARIGKLLLLAASLGCLAPALTIAACLSYKSPFAGGAQQDAADRARAALAAPGSGTIAAGQQSDHLLMVAAVDGWLAARDKGGHRGAREYSRRHFLSEQTLDMLADMRWQYATMLADIGVVAGPGRGGGSGGGRGCTWMDDPAAAFNRYAGHPAVVKAVLLAALYPNVAVMDDEAAPGKRPGWHDGTGEVALHPSSICHPLETQQFQRPYLTYLEKVRTSRTFIRDCTVASPLAILLFGGSLAVAHDSSYVQVDGWLRIRAPAQTAVVIKRLRAALDALLERKVRQPGLRLDEAGGQLIGSLVELLDGEEAALRWQ
ncbi:helicase domain-containing [Chlorella sorokiniana]|uniref:RNA helicase n=1 Tax=Chlorella sorokiniana TaxID=3076 RepID=A0A2P6TXA5_CHLSO|nr:helicase domain-containing [Chlorella sorokiniana]|eukprot:PRW58696.1 helicase domain-containing [Chlorella sorokiniana]